jgi:hypothetical protein
MERVEQKIQQVMDDLYRISARLQAFEQKYGLLSSDFYALYQAGQLDTGENLRDVTLWAGMYQMKLTLEETAHQLSRQRIEQLQAESPAGEVRLAPDVSVTA